MSGITAINGIPYPTLGDPPNIESVVKPAADHLDTRIIPRFATTTERDSAVTSPVAGQKCWVTTHGSQLYSPAAAWVPENGTEVLSVHRTTGQTITTATSTAIQFNANTYVPWGGHSTSTNTTRIIPPFPGRYLFIAGVGWSNTPSTQAVKLQKNGADLTGGRQQNTGAGLAGISTMITAEANGTTDYFEVLGFQASGADLATGTGQAACFCTIIFAGPAFI